MHAGEHGVWMGVSAEAGGKAQREDEWVSSLDTHNINRLGLQVVLFHWLLCLGRTKKKGLRSHSPEDVHYLWYVSYMTSPVSITWIYPPILPVFPKCVCLEWVSLSFTADLRICCLNSLQKAPSAICSSFLFSVHPNRAGCKQQRRIVFSFVFSWGESFTLMIF